MFTKFVIAFSILALAAAFAGNVPARGTYTVILSKPAVVMGTALKAGEYRVKIDVDKVVFNIDNKSFEIPAKIETGDRKFDTNRIQYNQDGNQARISVISLGGTKTELLFK